MNVRIFNTLTNRKEPLKPITPGKLGMYVCGVTVYDMCHVGHARAYVTADVIYRYLTHVGLDVTYVRNFTDVDDKIIARSNELAVDPRELSDRFIREFHVDMDALGIKRPQIEPRVTDHIGDIIEMVKTLIDKGHAYEVEGDVYFDVPSFKMYGRLSGANMRELLSGARVDVDDRKKSPADFALWKAAKPGEPAWDSPWGKGRPGWHIECSTMSTKYLGDTFDLHGGGKDLVFPHHENEIAQSEAATGKTFVNAFFHNGFVNIDKEKMSKSLGNFFTIREMTEKVSPEALRYFLLGTHYRSPLNFEVDFSCPACGAELKRQEVEDRTCPACNVSMDDASASAAVRFPALEEAMRRLEYLYQTRQRLDEHLDVGITGGGELLKAQEVEELDSRFSQAMDDDFNTAAALGVLADAMRISNEVMDNKDGHPAAMVTSTVQRLRDSVSVMSQVLGILEQDPAQALTSLRSKALDSKGVSPEHIDKLVAARDAARASKDWAEADRLRDELHAMGVELMDSPQGTTWKMKS